MRNLKKVLALVLAMAMSLSLAVTAGATSLADYSDSDEVTAKYAVAVDVATQLGVLKGMGDDVYAPQGTLTRAQLATMIYRITTGDVEDENTANFAGGAAESFTDTPATAWYAGYVAFSADAGYLKGMGDGTYAPNSSLTGYQALAALLRAMGYNEAGHNFCGADWKVQVAKYATSTGILEGVTANLDVAITREVAAQMIYNALFAEMVEWEGLVYDETGKSLAEEVFGIESEKDGEAAAGDFGRPSTEWYDDEGEVLVTIPEAPLAVYTEAVSECQIAVDMDLEENETVDLWVNGEKGALNVTLTDTDATVGGQGCLTEVYDGVVVCIDTYLAEVVDVITEKADSKGHIIRDAAIELDVFGVTANLFFETKSFDEGDMVLVTIDDGEVATVVDADSEIGELTGLTGNIRHTNDIQNVKAIDGKDVDVNRTAVYEEIELWLDINYVFYYDTYGNVIGSEEVADEYVVIDSIWFETIKGETTIYADIVDFDGNETEEVVVAENWTNFFINENKVLNQAFYYNVVEYIVEDGEYFFMPAFTDYGAVSYTAGDTTIFSTTPGVNTELNDETVVLMQTAFSPDGQYTTYTGVDNIPTFLASDVEVLEGADGYADLIYVLGARTSDRVVFVADIEAERTDRVNNETIVTMEALELVDGQLVETTFATRGWWDNGVARAADIDNVGLYEITESDDGFTWFVSEELPFFTAFELTTDGDRVIIGGQKYDLDDAEIFKFEGTKTAVEDVTWEDDWTKADLDQYSGVYMQFDEDDNVIGVYDMWFELDVNGQYVTEVPSNLFMGKPVDGNLTLSLPAHTGFVVTTGTTPIVGTPADAHNCGSDHAYCDAQVKSFDLTGDIFWQDIDVTTWAIDKEGHTGLDAKAGVTNVAVADKVVYADATQLDTFTVQNLLDSLRATCAHAQGFAIFDNNVAMAADTDLQSFAGDVDLTIVVTAEDGTTQPYSVVIYN